MWRLVGGGYVEDDLTEDSIGDGEVTATFAPTPAEDL